MGQNNNDSHSFEANGNNTVIQIARDFVNIQSKTIQINEFLIKDVVEVISDSIESNKLKIKDIDNNFIHPGMEIKNIKNNLTQSYYDTAIDMYEQYFYKFDLFFADPKNQKILKLYQSCAMEIKLKIKSIKKENDTFEKMILLVFDYIEEKYKGTEIFDNNMILFLALLHYMYRMCEIGEKA